MCTVLVYSSKSPGMQKAESKTHAEEKRLGFGGRRPLRLLHLPSVPSWWHRTSRRWAEPWAPRLCRPSFLPLLSVTHKFPVSATVPAHCHALPTAVDCMEAVPFFSQLLLVTVFFITAIEKLTNTDSKMT